MHALFVLPCKLQTGYFAPTICAKQLLSATKQEWGNPPVSSSKLSLFTLLYNQSRLKLTRKMSDQEDDERLVAEEEVSAFFVNFAQFPSLSLTNSKRRFISEFQNRFTLYGGKTKRKSGGR